MVVENLIRRDCIGNEDRIYYYKMTKSSIEIVGKDFSYQVQSYGIEIERHDLIANKLVNIEKDCIKSISPHRYKVHNLIKILTNNMVSPIHLVDIIGKYVDNFSCDFDTVKMPQESK